MSSVLIFNIQIIWEKIVILKSIKVRLKKTVLNNPEFFKLRLANSLAYSAETFPLSCNIEPSN